MTKELQTNITSHFWQRYRNLMANNSIPFQWDMINDNNKVEITNDAFAAGGSADKSHAIANLKIVAGQEKGHFFGMDFQDTDVYKWLESAAYVLKYAPSEKLHKEADSVVDLIAEAQEDGGYLSTMFQIEMPERKFKRLQQSHELYSMGHYIEAGVAYYEVTGNQKALMIAEKMAKCIGNHFGLEEGKVKGIPGHPEIELALARLYEATKNKKYLALAKYFITQRGKDTEFFDRQNEADGKDRNFFPGMDKFGNRYYFADKPVTEQQDVHGHAVRVLYFCTGLAHVARLTGDQELMKTAHRLWNDTVKKQMYITGNVGQTTTGEAFTYDYDLPNDSNYGETCASVAMVFFGKQMLASDLNGQYGDVIEKELFNGALSGIALDGMHYFYVNPLEADPKASKGNPGKNHINTQRSSWFACACCPSNITRLLSSVDKYLYQVKDNTILADQFIANETSFDDGIKIKLASDYPWDGKLTFTIENPQEKYFNFAVRIPSWSLKNYQVSFNGREIDPILEKQLVTFPITGSETQIIVNLDMRVHLMRANNYVKDDMGKVAIQRGPVIYCAEEEDNQVPLWCYRLRNKLTFTANYDNNLLDGVVTLDTNDVERANQNSEQLYYEDDSFEWTQAHLRLIPYYAWANRSNGQMQVWFNKA
ncbi:glycoside hydrolase family 127 protein [Limosilactobacillus sp. STM2_1]|uniref:Glycoside hydrolase family 127 protein n=1 Tax=Limosilactobacillus rudii TaxID=2759755 RepID=A0A7W3YNZ3_9LACO|nr:beta-L-arabinofuranosidase domain-containing protein [Limosilactobacillus rudii]MBB1079917.1 glycoside hydrolase family 127 protein [Limosilactobacillus rudii]MBB1097996.1 glycoside hydrolase family 127 protein [Limosilactobacillus rudii]MCD7135065.1 glycoside hydrolase family 127 protein [Limosilactobacillus rudii]